MAMDLWQLHIFCKVVELKSFSKAGDRAHLSQPTVSTHIKDLENHFNCRLIDRLSKEAVPTKAGVLLYGYAKKMISLREEAETALFEFHGLMRGRLTIGGSTIPGVYILPCLVSRFIREYPDVKLSLKIGSTGRIIKNIATGEVELGVVGAGAGDRRIIQEKLIEDEMCVAVPGNHPWGKKKSITLDMLVKEPFIIRESGSGTLQSFQNSLSKAGMRLKDFNVIAEMGSTAAVIQGIKTGIGVSVLSSVAVAEYADTRALTCLKVTGLDLKRNFYLTRSAHRSESPLCLAFREFICKESAK